MSSKPSRLPSDKEAACLNCRRSKVKCKKNPGLAQCERCAASGSECTIPSFHIGRQKGVKNKRTGLDKAIHQIEQAIKQTRGDSTELRRLLNEANHASLSFDSNAQRPDDDPILSAQLPAPTGDNEQLQYDDIENPLQLLARASDLQQTSPQASSNQAPTPRTPQVAGSESKSKDVNQFFLPLRATLDVDDGAKITNFDPIDAGLVTIEEAQSLMEFFHKDLAHTRWGLDTDIHTLEFVRSQSAFLFTSMLAASALFISSAAALAKRLQMHRDWLAKQVMTRRLRSVEIVLAFTINIPWMHPGQHAADDDTGLYVSYALSISLDLSLNKIVMPSRFLNMELANRISSADCVDARKALNMDGFEDVPVDSQWGQRLLRRRERTWFALFVLERGVCLARGRSYSVPQTPLVKYCDYWLSNEATHPGDGAMISMASLRRDLDGVFDAVRSRCDGYRLIDVGSKVAAEIETTINQFFDKWMTTWTNALGKGQHDSLPPYVEILVIHTRLSTYGGIINHPTAPLEVKRLFRASTLSSALNVMRAAIQGENRLSSMPNNTVIMICFAACVAVQLSTVPAGTNSQLAPSILNLVEETAAVLDRIGNITPHRNGASIIYAKHLKELLQRVSNRSQLLDTSAGASATQQFSSDVDMSRFEHTSMPQHQYTMPSDWIEPLQFSTMSDNQILESVLSAAPDFNSMLTDLDPMNADNMWMNFMSGPDFGI